MPPPQNSAELEKFNRYLDNKTFADDQIQSITFIIEHLTESGTLDPSLLYDRPFIDLHERGLDGIFPDLLAQEIIGLLMRSIKYWQSSRVAK